MFIHEQFAQRQVGIELGDVGLGIGDIRGAAEVVTVIEEDVFDVGRVRWEIAIARLRIVRVFGLVPLNERFRWRQRGVALRLLRPTFGHRVGGTIFLVCRNVIAADAADIAELLSTPSLLTTCLCR